MSKVDLAMSCGDSRGVSRVRGLHSDDIMGSGSIVLTFVDHVLAAAFTMTR